MTPYLMLRPLVDPGELPMIGASPEILSSPSLSFLTRSTEYHLLGTILFLLRKIMGPDPVSNL